jgi:hypothetical protein
MGARNNHMMIFLVFIATQKYEISIKPPNQSKKEAPEQAPLYKATPKDAMKLRNDRI